MSTTKSKIDPKKTFLIIQGAILMIAFLLILCTALFLVLQVK